ASRLGQALGGGGGGGGGCFGGAGRGHAVSGGDLGVRAGQEPCGAAGADDHTAWEVGRVGDPAAVFVGGGPADVLACRESLGVVADLLQDEFEFLDRDVLKPVGVRCARVVERHLGVDMAVLEGCCDQAARAADDEAGQRAPESAGVEIP